MRRQRLISFDDISAWIALTPQERRGNSGSFALARGISPTAFSRLILRNGKLTPAGKRRFGDQLDALTDTRVAPNVDPIEHPGSETAQQNVAPITATDSHQASPLSSTLLRQ